MPPIFLALPSGRVINEALVCSVAREETHLGPLYVRFGDGWGISLTGNDADFVEGYFTARALKDMAFYGIQGPPK